MIIHVQGVIVKIYTKCFLPPRRFTKSSQAAVIKMLNPELYVINYPKAETYICLFLIGHSNVPTLSLVTKPYCDDTHKV
jgi:hypothetical protein